MIDFLKNFLALIFSTIVWAAGLWALLSIYYFIVELDYFYLISLGICIVIISAGVLISRYNKRLQAALEFPFGILHL
jgi:hypothetical protein